MLLLINANDKIYHLNFAVSENDFPYFMKAVAE